MSGEGRWEKSEWVHELEKENVALRVRVAELESEIESDVVCPQCGLRLDQA